MLINRVLHMKKVSVIVCPVLVTCSLCVSAVECLAQWCSGDPVSRSRQARPSQGGAVGPCGAVTPCSHTCSDSHQGRHQRPWASTATTCEGPPEWPAAWRGRPPGGRGVAPPTSAAPTAPPSGGCSAWRWAAALPSTCSSASRRRSTVVSSVFNCFMAWEHCTG